MQLADPEVSGQHAILWWDAEQGHAVVADRPGSFNGTYLRLSSEREPSAAYPLHVGDCLVIGDHVLTLLAKVAEAGGAHTAAAETAAEGVKAPTDPKDQGPTMRSSPARAECMDCRGRRSSRS